MTPDLASKITKAKKSGYSDAEIATFLTRDSAVAPKIAEARSHGYDDASIIGFLAKPQGYGQAKARIAKTEAANRQTGEKMGLGAVNALSDFVNQVGRNTGVRDEIAGGIGYVTQGAANLGRRLVGAPIEVSAAGAAQAAIDYEREQQAAYAKAHPVGNALAHGAVFFGSGAPARGVTPSPMSALKAGGIAAGVNAPFALGRQKGKLEERLPGAAMETALAFGTGAALQGASNALGRSAAKAKAARLSPERQLSQEGVDLTPGQMAGGLVKRGEDVLTSAPLTGASINAARKRGIETFDRAAINRALSPIGQAIGKDAPVGREGVRLAQQRISQAYDNALGGVAVAPDQQFSAEVSQVLADPRFKAVAGDLKAEADNLASRFGGQIDGYAWKAIDEDLGKAAAAAAKGSQSKSTDRFLREGIENLQDAFRGLLARANPKAAAEIGRADEAYANLVRIERAAGGVGAKEGVFTPAQLQNAVRAADTTVRKRGFAARNALMQDLSEAGKTVLPSEIPDSGTALRVFGLGGMLGGANAFGGAGGAATALTADVLGAAAYSKPAMAALNAVYRASSPGQARQALATLGSLAARDPALVPAYRAAAAQLGVQLPPSDGRQNALADQPGPTMR